MKWEADEMRDLPSESYQEYIPHSLANIPRHFGWQNTTDVQSSIEMTLTRRDVAGQHGSRVCLLLPLMARSTAALCPLL